MLYLFWYNTFIVLFINDLYNYLRQGAVSGSAFVIVLINLCMKSNKVCFLRHK